MGRRVNVKVVANPAIRRAAMLVCGELTSCFPPGQNAGRVTHEPDPLAHAQTSASETARVPIVAVLRVI